MWIHWSSPVTSAKASILSCVTSCHSETPSSSPILLLSSSIPLTVSMQPTLAHGAQRRPATPAGGLVAALREVGLREQQLRGLRIVRERGAAGARRERLVDRDERAQAVLEAAHEQRGLLGT